MDHLSVGPEVSQALVSSASSVALLVSTRCGHRRPRTPDMPSTSTTDASGSQKVFGKSKKNTRGPCRQLKMARITQVTNGHITMRYNEQHRGAPTAEQISALAHDIGHVIRTYCPMQWKSWKVMLDQVRTKVRTLLSTNDNFEDINNDMLAYGGSKFPEIDVFSDVYVRLGDELAKSLHLDVTDCTSPQSVWHSSPGFSSSSTSKPFQPEHGHTSAPLTSELVNNLKTFQPPPQDDHVDYAALFS
ncbi:hypothetical protein C1H46_041295 [Malus baccata]|uniref:Uncharacterized protein n=1 Tax=Malus baccata TaxID=106549 RepID=A0A540KG12_MALBA|nr:hypothetical protein C1H46_041295 [Malus baccata]